MNNRLIGEAALSTVDFVRGKSEINNASAHGLEQKSTRAFPVCGLSRVGGNVRSWGIMFKPSRMRRCECGSSLKLRRITAAPCFSQARGVFFWTHGTPLPKQVRYGGIRKHGLIASNDFMGAPCGEPSGSPFPKLRSFHTRTVPPACGRADGFDSLNLGAPAMTLHDAEGAPARALNLGVCKLLNLINRLTGRAGGVRPRGSYPGVDLGMHIPSIFDLNPELLELAHAEALKHSQEVRHD